MENILGIFIDYNSIKTVCKYQRANILLKCKGVLQRKERNSHCF